MQISNIILAALASLATASPAVERTGTFHITNFHITKTEPTYSSVTNFNVTLNKYATVQCSVKDTDKSYVFCGAAPEQAYYAYIAKNGNERVLNLEFELSFPQKTTRTYGTKVLKHPAQSFDVPAHAAPTPA